MKKVMFFLLMFNSMLMVSAQDSWKVYLNKTMLLSSTEENEQKNLISISRASLHKTGELVITYLEEDPQKDWSRSISIFDQKDNELYKKENTRLLKLSNTSVQKLFNGQSKIFIFSWTIPNDPELAARIRIRRVHLCTIELK